MAAYASFDQGATWYGRGMLPGLEPDFCGNATVAFDAHGHGFVCGVVATSGPSRHGDARIWRTDDGGRSFHPPATALTGGAGLVDHPSLAIGRPAHPSPLYIAARMYGTAADDGLVLARSLDGGRTFEQPRRIDPATGASAVAPVLAAGPADVLTVVYVAPSASDGVALRAVVSYDRGESFTAPIDLAQVAGMAPDLGDVTAKSGPAVASAPGSGRTYAAMTGFDDRTGTSRLLLTATTGSTAGSHAWTPPMTVAVSDTTVYLQPQLAVTGDDRVALSVYALSIETARIDVLLYSSQRVRPGPAPISFGPPLRVTTRPFDPRQAVNTGSTHWLGNYQGLAATPGQIHPIWTDTRTGDTQIFTATVHPGGTPRPR
jgi:hypothetical protein